MSREDNAARNFLCMSTLAELMAGNPDTRWEDLLPEVKLIADRKTRELDKQLAVFHETIEGS